MSWMVYVFLQLVSIQAFTWSWFREHACTSFCRAHDNYGIITCTTIFIIISIYHALIGATWSYELSEISAFLIWFLQIRHNESVLRLISELSSTSSFDFEHSLILKIHLLHKKATRICTGAQYLAHTHSLFSDLKTLKVFDTNSLQISLIFLYKYKNKLLPGSFHNFITLNSAIHSYPTRNSPNYHLVNPRLLRAHKSIRHHGPDLWNALPDSIKSCTKSLRI